MKNKIFVLVFCFLSITSVAQINFIQKSYIITDSTTIYNVDLVSRGSFLDSQACAFRSNNEIILYTPYQLQGYMLKNGKKYVSKDIQDKGENKKVFLEVLHEGKLTLYNYKKPGRNSFYLENDNKQFVELKKKGEKRTDFKTKLKALTNDCPDISAQIEHISYSRASLTRLLKNHDKCKIAYLPHLRAGFMTGIEKLNITRPEYTISQKLDAFKTTKDYSLCYGISADMPILFTNFIFHPELFFSKHGYSDAYSEAEADYDYLVNVSSIRVPLMIKYMAPFHNYRPYINLGAQYSKNIKHESYIFKTVPDGIFYHETYNILKKPLIPVDQFGFIGGLGVEINFYKRASVMIEIRNSYFPSDSSQNFAQLNGFQLLTGIIF